MSDFFNPLNHEKFTVKSIMKEDVKNFITKLKATNY